MSEQEIIVFSSFDCESCCAGTTRRSGKQVLPRQTDITDAKGEERLSRLIYELPSFPLRMSPMSQQEAVLSSLKLYSPFENASRHPEGETCTHDRPCVECYWKSSGATSTGNVAGSRGGSTSEILTPCLVVRADTLHWQNFDMVTRFECYPRTRVKLLNVNGR